MLRLYKRTLTIGIRREAKNRWERRVPLTPTHLSQLVSQNHIKFLVQPSSKRIYPDSLFSQAGATIQEDLSPADVIIGVKEVPKTELLADKTYLFFSHTYKGQPYNMGMLKEML